MSNSASTNALRESEAAAQEARRLLQLSLAASNAGVWNYTISNQRFSGDAAVAQMFGLPVEAVIAGQIPLEDYLNVIHSSDRLMVEQALCRAVEFEESVDIDYRVLHADGSTTWVMVRSKLERDEAGLPLRFPGLAFDITQRKQDEEALRVSEQRFRQMADDASVMVWVTEADSSCSYLSKSWYEFTGRTPTNSLGFGWIEPIHPDDRELSSTTFFRAHQQRTHFNLEYRLRRYDGEYFWVLDQAAPHFSEDGRFLGYIGSVIDISERKQSEARDRFLFQLLDTTRSLVEPDAIATTSTRMLGEYLGADRCTYTEINTSEAHFTITGEYTMPGMSSIVERFSISSFSDEAQQLLHAGYPYVVADITHDPRAMKYRALHESMQTAAIIAVPLLKQGRLAAGMTLHQRIPRIWKADEIELVHLVANLCWESIERARVTRTLRASEERLQTLYAQEQVARRQAEEASRLKDDFLATVSHELRTPLTAILGYGHLLLSRRRDEQTTTHLVETIVQSATAQAQLIEDLLDVSRIVTGKLHLAPSIINFISVTQAAIDTVRPALEAKGLNLETNLDPAASTIRGDASRLQQVVWNLLSNAVKFTPAGGTITMDLQAIDSYAQLSISDNGRGISADFLPYVFDRFRQADSTSTRAHGGLGLGLSIVRHLVEMHGGIVQARSDGLDRGTTFTVRLPYIARTDEASKINTVADPTIARWECLPELDGLRMLVVDDQPAILEMLYELFAPCGTIVRRSATAREALATLRTWRPDIIISDIAMPNEDGYWLMQHIRALPTIEGRDTPAVALTAYARAEDRVRVLAAGFQHYLAKPVQPAELFATVAKLVKHSPPR